ncbi:MAG TPA: hypothetical protein VFH56_02945 [Acidimicrobiales bacterium]|nr:hypothetical protein [Acidimicrobiales bacterium]
MTLTLPRESGYILTVDGESAIALCGGWEMSTQCRRGRFPGEQHVLRMENGIGWFSPRYWCGHCDMPLHPISWDDEDSELMSIEHHTIEELPW